MKLTFRLKQHNSKDLEGFINTLTDNGYEVSFRKGNALKMMCDIKDDDNVIRGDNSNDIIEVL